jgi:hypothetical protein
MTGSDDAFLPPDPAALGSAGPAAQDDSGVAAVLARQTDALMARSGVVMVGETRDAQGRPAILVGVRTSRDIARLPREIDGVPVVLQVVGDVVAL